MAMRMKIHRPPDFRGLTIGVCANGRRAGVYSLTARCGGIAGLTGVAAGWLQGAAGVGASGTCSSSRIPHREQKRAPARSRFRQRGQYVGSVIATISTHIVSRSTAPGAKKISIV